MTPRSRKIGIVAPACRINQAEAEAVGEIARALYPDGRVSLVFHPQCFLSQGHFAGSDQERAAAFLEIANDPSIDAVWFARGGYGSFRILDAVMARLEPAAFDKVWLGYSDLGSVLGALYRRGAAHVAHGPMVGEIKRPGGEALIRRALSWLVEGNPAALEPTAASGVPSVAFNVTILAHLAGTPWFPDLTGRVLMLEEVSEPLYRLDRALGQIFSAPGLGGPLGVRLGRCSDMLANDPDFNASEEDVVRFWAKRAGLDFLGSADIGHDIDNKIVPFGKSES